MRSQLRMILVISAVGMAACAAPGSRPKELTETERARLFVEVANGALVEGDAIGALENLARAERIDSSLPELHHSRALAYYMKKENDKALDSARVAVKLKPDYSQANNTLGKFLIDEGKYAEAEAPLLSAAKDPLNREAYKANTNLGILYYRTGKYSIAAKHLDKAVDEAPAAACIAYYYRGHLKLKDGHVREATREYEKATEKFCAGFADAHFALGIAHERDRNYDQARKVFLSIKQNFPNSKIAEQAMTRLKHLP